MMSKRKRDINDIVWFQTFKAQNFYDIALPKDTGIWEISSS